MPDLTTQRTETTIPPSGQHGFVTRAPAAIDEPMEVNVPDFSGDHFVQVRRWDPRGVTLPALEDEVLVVKDDHGEAWVPVWWPAGGDVPTLSEVAVLALVAAEKKAREEDVLLAEAAAVAGDTANATALAAEVKVRGEADTAATKALEAETKAREAADATEKTARELADSTLRQRSNLILVRAATTAALAANTLVGAVLEATANGALAAQDGVALALGDRLLVKNEVEGKKNGVYEVTSLGAVGAKYKLTRIAAMDESAEAVPGTKIVAAEGTQNGGVEFSLLTTGAINLGVTALTFGLGSAWTNLPLTANWIAYASFGAVPGFRKSPDGRVSLRGLLQPAAAGQLQIGTLPEGARPAANGPNGVRGFACIGTPAGGAVQVVRVDVYPSGAILPEANFAGAASNFYLFLDSISFYID